MCFELNRTIKASNANLHIFKMNRSSPYISEFMGCKECKCVYKRYTWCIWQENSLHFKRKGILVLLGLTGQTGLSWQTLKTTIHQSRPQNANLHLFKQIGAPPISQNSWGWNSVYVSTEDTRDAYDKKIHFISKEKEFWFC